jgi:hypothetical protein
MISPGLRSIIDCSIWPDDRPRPTLIPPDRPVDDVPVAVPEPAIAYLSPVRPRRELRHVSAAAVSAALEALRDIGAGTVDDVTRKMGARGYRAGKSTVLMALAQLQRQRRVRSVRLRTARDIERAGGRLLWEVR